MSLVAMNVIGKISETEFKEVSKNNLEKINENCILDKMDEIKHLTPEQLSEKMEENIIQMEMKNNSHLNEIENIKKDFSEEQRNKIKEDSGWSDEIVDNIGSEQEYEIYKNAGLSEEEIGNKNALIRNDIDWEQKDIMGRTNKQRAEQGLSPINKDGKVIELHHIGQHADSPLAELTPEEHRGKGNDTILHDKTKVSEIDRTAFADERAEHWETRAKEESDNR